MFDTTQGADDANVTPTKFSGGSRVIQYGLVSLRQMATVAAVCLRLAAAIGLVLLATRGRPRLLVIGVVGIVVSRATPRRRSSSSIAAWARSRSRSGSGR